MIEQINGREYIWIKYYDIRPNVAPLYTFNGTVKAKNLLDDWRDEDAIRT